MESAPRSRVTWSKTYRAISSRFPPVDLYERVSNPDEFDDLFAIEAMTNPRIRDEVGDIALVPPHERVFGPGASWVMGAFTHCSDRKPNRFSDGTFGVYYAAKQPITAIRETAFHLGRTFADTRAAPGETSELRMLVGAVDTELLDVRSGFASLHDPDDYSKPQAFGSKARAVGENGIVYRSVRDPGGQCLGALRPKAVSIPIQGPHYEYHWNGSTFDKYCLMGEGQQWSAI